MIMSSPKAVESRLIELYADQAQELVARIEVPV